MIHAPRFNGWINERLLNHCKPGQLWVGISRGSLFDAEALALALTDGRIDAMMLDGAGPQFAAPGSVLQVFQKGYVLNDRLLRPALVVVARAD